LITGRLVKDYTAMTGEISLRGNVLPVGGIKEKCLAAHRSGVKEILIPRLNDRDLEEIPEAIRKNVKFHLLDRVETALELALRPKSGKPRSSGNAGTRKPVRSSGADPAPQQPAAG
jgi:ATP-dependent Lon protease